ncbi:MAG: 3'-5' exonuclease [Rhodoferax sp.]
MDDASTPPRSPLWHDAHASPWQRLRGWWARRGAPAPTRWVVVDVESSGLDTGRDRLLAIAAVALQVAPAGQAQAPCVRLGDSFEVVLRQDEAQARATDKSNILLHGIGVGAQRQGVEGAQALQAFAHWLGDAPLLAYHSAFDEAMIQREMGAVLGKRLDNPWTDLAEVVAVLYPQSRLQSLDDWMAHFGIRCAQRHQAAADVLSTAELLLCLWPALRAQVGVLDYGALHRLARQRRWLRD